MWYLTERPADYSGVLGSLLLFCVKALLVEFLKK